jgi:hypothetical protein
VLIAHTEAKYFEVYTMRSHTYTRIVFKILYNYDLAKMCKTLIYSILNPLRRNSVLLEGPDISFGADVPAAWTIIFMKIGPDILLSPRQSVRL